MITLSLQALRLFFALNIVVGLAYPLSVTFLGQMIWPFQANGSLITVENRAVGSHLLAQKVESPRLFWPRPSASDFGSVPSGASNLGPTSEVLKTAVQERRARTLTDEMLFASGSGLDPHVSVHAAINQVTRIVQARNMNDDEKQDLVKIINDAIEKRDLGFLGEERINVLALNLKLIERFGR